MTVPAIWTDKAKAMMREAAIKAGIIDGHDPLERLVFVAEPEAAAAYCENKYNAWNLSHECRFMIVDAGGGTIDLIT
jgi:molecular chaperone DnaK (HSP70)